jgi:hypothetical protein
MNTRSLFRLLLLCVSIGLSFKAVAQPFTSSGKVMFREQKNHWGIKADLNGSESYPEMIPIVGATYTMSNRHQFFAGIMLNPFMKYVKSPLLGSNIMYQYYPFRHRRIFNAFAYYSNDIGKYTTNASVTYVTQDTAFHFHPGHLEQKNFVITNILGIGFDLMAGKHFFGNILVGSGLFYRHYQSTLTDSNTGERNSFTKHNITDLALEIRLGIGWRF